MSDHGIREFRDGAGSMICFGAVYRDKASADKALAAYKQEYAPEGYGTKGRIDPPEHHQGLYVLVGTRYASCD